MTERKALPVGSRVAVGDTVSVALTGTLVDYDPINGWWTLRGHAPGQEHIEWAWKLHWATEFTPVDPA